MNESESRFTVSTAAELTGVPKDTIGMWRSKGKIPVSGVHINFDELLLLRVTSSLRGAGMTKGGHALRLAEKAVASNRDVYSVTQGTLTVVIPVRALRAELERRICARAGR
jgi:hypothetical protein